MPDLAPGPALSPEDVAAAIEARRAARAEEITGRLNPEQARAVTTTDGPLLILAGRRLGQDARRRPPHRLPHRRQGGPAPPDPRGHVHEPCRRRAPGADPRAGRGDGQGRRGRDVPRAVCPRAAARRRGHRAGPAVRHLRHGRPAAADEADPRRAGPAGHGRVPARGDPGRDQPGQERHARRGRSSPRTRSTTASGSSRGWPPATRSACARWARSTSTTSCCGPWSCSSRRPRCWRSTRQRWRYLHVDEYQDTNRPQYLWVRALAAAHRNLCVVGDDDQSIYGWRGANVQNILDFERDYPDATVVKLEQNYRSTQLILDAAHAVVSRNERRTDKKLWTENQGGVPIQRFEAFNEEEEAEWIARQVEGLVGSTGQGRLADPARRRRRVDALPAQGPRRHVPHELPVPGHRGGVPPLRDPLPARGRDAVLPAARGQGRAGLPAGAPVGHGRRLLRAGHQRPGARRSATRASRRSGATRTGTTTRCSRRSRRRARRGRGAHRRGRGRPSASSTR